MSSINIDEKLKKLSEIAEWFETREDVNIEEGLAKVKEAAEIIKVSKSRLQEIENEFEEIKKDVGAVVGKETVSVSETEAAVSISTDD